MTRVGDQEHPSPLEDTAANRSGTSQRAVRVSGQQSASGGEGSVGSHPSCSLLGEAEGPFFADSGGGAINWRIALKTIWNF